MKKFLLLFLVAVVSTAFYTGAPVPREKHRVRMMVRYLSDGKTDTTEYYYKADGHISYTENPQKKKFSCTYHYLPGMVIRRYHDDMRNRSFSDTMFLNKKGLVEKYVSGNRLVWTLMHFYNSDGQLIKSMNLEMNGKESYSTIYGYLNGNRISRSALDPSGSTYSWLKYQYYTDKPNTIGNENFGLDFAGADCRNPEKYSSLEFMGRPNNYKYYYHYDERGRISIKAHYDVESGKLLDSTSYTYYSGVRLVIEKK